MPIDIRELPTINTFERQLKLYMKSRIVIKIISCKSSSTINSFFILIDNFNINNFVCRFFAVA